MFNRRNFLKNLSLGTLTLTIPKITYANVKNWTLLESKFYSPIHVPDNWQLTNKEIIEGFNGYPLCTDIIEGSPIYISEQYYVDNIKWARENFDPNIEKDNTHYQVW